MKYLSFVYLFDCFEAQQIVPIYEISRKKTFKNTQFPHLVCFVIKGEKMERKKMHISLYFHQIDDLIKTLEMLSKIQVTSIKYTQHECVCVCEGYIQSTKK